MRANCLVARMARSYTHSLAGETRYVGYFENIHLSAINL